jgi:putative DNA primase/helicase
MGYEIIGVDVDGESGAKLLDELSNGDLPSTVEFRRGATSRRLLYRVPAGETLQTTSYAADDGELRILAGGSQTVAPPSLHASGDRYEWAPGHAPGEIEIALVPTWLRAFAKTRTAAETNGHADIPPGVLTPALRARVLAYLSQCPPAISGQHGHDVCFGVCRSIVYGFNLRVDVAYQLLAEFYNPRCVPSWSPEELKHKIEDASEKPFDKERGYLLADGEEVFTIRAPGHGERNGTASAENEANETPAEETHILESVDDPHRLARLIIDSEYRRDGLLALRYWRGEWYRCDGAAYRRLSESELRAVITRYAKAEMDAASANAKKKKTAASKVTRGLIANVLNALASMSILPNSLEAPAWIEGDGPHPADEMLAAKNGLVHLPTLRFGNMNLLGHTPLFFALNALDYEFDAEAPLPTTWLGFLKSLWPNDPASIATLQEWLGYLLTPDTRQQKVLLLVGPKRGGKGTIGRVIRGLVGYENVAAPTLTSLGTNFGLWPLLGKTIAIISDARLSGRSDSAMIIERLLSLSGEDAATVDRKNLEPITTMLTARFVILTNELPRLDDASGAFASRMIVLQLTRSWLGHEDTALKDKLRAELPGILLWAIDGWRRLHDRGHFQQPESSVGLVQELEDLSSPISVFIREECVLGPEWDEAIANMFAAWQTWCDQKGKKNTGNEQELGRKLRAAVPTLKVSQPRRDGKQIRVYVGIRLKTPDEIGADTQ